MDKDTPSYGTILKEVGASVSGLLKSELELAKAEFKAVSHGFGRYMALATAFGALLTLSVFPLLAFFVIGLGKLLGGMYWLSALIVAAVCAAVGGTMTAVAYVKLRNLGLDFPHARHGLEQEREAVVDKVEELRNVTKRRAA